MIINQHIHRALVAGFVLTAALTLSGCGLFFGGSQEAAPTPTLPPRTLVPTFTPTPVLPETPTPAPVATQPPQVIPVAIAPPVDSAPLTQTTAVSTTAAVDATATPAAVKTPGLKVEVDIINVRTGPGTDYGLVGTATLGEKFDIKGRNAEKTWYLICCVNGQEGWVNTEFTDESNEELATVVEAPGTGQPVAQAPAQAAPAQPAPAQPEPTAAPAAPAPAADACAGIGGDGCKFKLRGGPKFSPNGGSELKFQLHFIHSGIDGGQPQGSYFVWVEKDGQKLPVSDSVRSVAQSDQQGPNGKYNYEYKVSPDSIPGNNIAGNYVIWVLDGNGERDSQSFGFTVPDGQGEVWIEFDQG